MSLAYSLSLTTPGEKPGSDHQGKMSEAEVMEVFHWLQCGHWYSSANTQLNNFPLHYSLKITQSLRKSSNVGQLVEITLDLLPDLKTKRMSANSNTHHTDLRKDPGGIVWNVTPVKGGKINLEQRLKNGVTQREVKWRGRMCIWGVTHMWLYV